MDSEKKMESLLEQAAAHDARMAAHHEQFMAEMAEMRERQRSSEDRHDRLEQSLRRAIRMNVEEHRRERVRRKKSEAEWNARMTRLEEAQERTDKTLQSFIDSLR